ncbi:MAG: 50S ribosomal protein L10 [Bdellovibrionota bacterium]
MRNCTSSGNWHYAGVTVEKITAFRSKLRESGIELKVIKNTLATRAIEGTELSELKDFFKGPTALAYTDSDPVALAKAVKQFSTEEEKFIVQAGVLNGKLLQKADVISLANVPSREILLGRMVGACRAPMLAWYTAYQESFGVGFCLLMLSEEKKKNRANKIYCWRNKHHGNKNDQRRTRKFYRVYDGFGA